MTQSTWAHEELGLEFVYEESIGTFWEAGTARRLPTVQEAKGLLRALGIRRAYVPIAVERGWRLIVADYEGTVRFVSRSATNLLTAYVVGPCTLDPLANAEHLGGDCYRLSGRRAVLDAPPKGCGLLRVEEATQFRRYGPLIVQLAYGRGLLSVEGRVRKVTSPRVSGVAIVKQLT